MPLNKWNKPDQCESDNLYYSPEWSQILLLNISRQTLIAYSQKFKQIDF